jgi:hypothetical protein
VLLQTGQDLARLVWQIVERHLSRRDTGLLIDFRQAKVRINDGRLRHMAGRDDLACRLVGPTLDHSGHRADGLIPLRGDDRWRQP